MERSGLPRLRSVSLWDLNPSTSSFADVITFSDLPDVDGYAPRGIANIRGQSRGVRLNFHMESTFGVEIDQIARQCPQMRVIANRTVQCSDRLRSVAFQDIELRGRLAMVATFRLVLHYRKTTVGR